MKEKEDDDNDNINNENNNNDSNDSDIFESALENMDIKPQITQNETQENSISNIISSPDDSQKNNNLIVENNNTVKNNKFEIIEDYFDFQMHDINLYLIERHFKNNKLLSNDEINNINIMVEQYKKFISGNLNQTIYPYLSNSLKIYFSSFQNQNSKKFLLIELLGKKRQIKSSLFNYFKTLTETNFYGISPKIKQYFNNKVIESKDFHKFCEKLSKWHCHVEIIIFYLDILCNIFNNNFSFDKQIFSLDRNFKNNSDLLVKKNIYKLASSICGKISLSPDLDYKKLLVFAMTTVTAGIDMGGLFNIIPKKHLGRMVGVFGLNFLTSKMSTHLGSASNFVMFNELSKLVEKLNKNLFKIERYCYNLIILQLQEEMNIDLETSKIDIIGLKIKEIGEELDLYLKGVDYSIEIDKLVKEEFIELEEVIKEEKYEDWLIENLNIKEVEGNNNEYSYKSKNKNEKKCNYIGENLDGDDF